MPDPNAAAPQVPIAADADAVPPTDANAAPAPAAPNLEQLAQAVEDAEDARFSAQAKANAAVLTAKQLQAAADDAHTKAGAAIAALVAGARAIDEPSPMTAPGGTT